MITSPTNFYFKENSIIKVFVATFKPAGFSYLFRVNANELTNLLPDFFSFAGSSECNILTEQLAESENFKMQATVLDNFFIKKIPRHFNGIERIGSACGKLITTNGLINIKSLAYHTNMSQRTLERRFIDHVGVSPKVYARFKRLHNALSLMNSKKPYSWTDIAYTCGYYDQAHFIKEFKSFTHHSPSAYTPHEYMLYNQFILYRNYSVF